MPSNLESFFVDCAHSQKIWCELEYANLQSSGLQSSELQSSSNVPVCTKLLVLLNGYQRDSSDFRSFRKRIRSDNENLAVLVIDNRGCGNSPIDLAYQNTDFSLSLLAADAQLCIQVTLQKLKLQKFSLLGISMGGMIAQIVASQNENCENLVLVSTTAGGASRVWPNENEEISGQLQSENRLTYKPWPKTLDQMKRRMERYFGSRYLKNFPLVVHKMCESLVKKYSSEVSSEISTNNSNEQSKAQFFASASHDSTNLLSQIKCKTLVVTGTEDRIVPKENSYVLEHFIQNATLQEYPEVGHLILAEEPALFVQHVSQFLKGN